MLGGGSMRLRTGLRFGLSMGLVVAGGLALVWALGGYQALLDWVLIEQRRAQSALAAAMRALRGGQPGAMAALMGVCFSYGVLHAAGPGHGKVLIGAYGLGERVRLVPLAAIALAASLAQAATAVLLVYGFFAALGWTRTRIEGVAEQVMVPVGTLAVMAVGLWLCGRGLARLWRGRVDAGAHDDGHDGHGHDGHVHGPGCGHAHGPSMAEVNRVAGVRDVVLLIGGIALRPCTGALFLLILTWQMGIAFAGIAGAFAMGLGTALVTVAVAGLSVWAREGFLANLSGRGVARVLPWLEVFAGALVVMIALGLLQQGR